METLVLTGLLVSGTLWSMVRSIRWAADHRMKRALPVVASKLGLTLDGPSDDPAGLHGTVHGMHVVLERLPIASHLRGGPQPWTLDFRGAPALPPSVDVGPRWRDSGVDSIMSKEVRREAERADALRTRTGDVEFDERIALYGEMGDVLLVASLQARQVLYRLIQLGAIVQNGSIAIHRVSLNDADSLSEFIQNVAELGAQLTELMRIPRHELIGRVFGEPYAPEMRRAAARQLVSEVPDDPRTAQMLVFCLNAGDAELASWAMAHVDATAIPALMEITQRHSLPSDDRPHWEISSAEMTERQRVRQLPARALLALVRLCPQHPQLPSLARTLWRDGNNEARSHLLTVAEALGMPELREWLEWALQRRAPIVDATAAQLLARSEHPAVHPLRVPSLSHPNAEVVDAILRGLMRFATESDVLGLWKAIESNRLSSSHQATARLIVEQIQSRRGDPSSGAIALIEAVGGDLALVDANGPPAGQGSDSPGP